MYLEVRGRVLRDIPQQGHQYPSQLINISQGLHLFCPIEYLNPLDILFALNLLHIPLHVTNQHLFSSGFDGKKFGFIFGISRRKSQTVITTWTP